MSTVVSRIYIKELLNWRKKSRILEYGFSWGRALRPDSFNLCVASEDVRPSLLLFVAEKTSVSEIVCHLVCISSFYQKNWVLSYFLAILYFFCKYIKSSSRLLRSLMCQFFFGPRMSFLRVCRAIFSADFLKICKFNCSLLKSKCIQLDILIFNLQHAFIYWYCWFA